MGRVTPVSEGAGAWSMVPQETPGGPGIAGQSGQWSAPPGRVGFTCRAGRTVGHPMRGAGESAPLTWVPARSGRAAGLSVDAVLGPEGRQVRRGRRLGRGLELRGGGDPVPV